MTEVDACAVCRRREPPVCPDCGVRMADQLASLPHLLGRLTYALVPGPGGGERVSSSREAPLPIRLAALTLTAGGSVRADDQSGVLPIRPWLAAWERDWRHTFGHALRPAENVPAAAAEPRRYPTLPERARTLLGLGASLMPADRPTDPVADEWVMRWPAGTPDLATADHLAYLSTWLPYACDHHPYVADFAAGLRALVGAARSALGDTDDLQYLGRCPEDITDHDTGRTVVCGAALRHDPHVSLVTCPRCHTETGQQHLVWLARRILDVWPIDAWRRYPRGLIEVLRLPGCGRCGAVVVVDWVDATERADRERFWRPGRVSCSADCDLIEVT